MKNLSLLVWLTQLGMSVAVPPLCFIGLAVWLRNSFDWGQWVIWVGIVLGIYCAITGFVSTLRSLLRLSDDKKKEAPPAAFNEHD
jgi:Na+-driven multidrug efflux pump